VFRIWIHIQLFSRKAKAISQKSNQDFHFNPSSVPNPEVPSLLICGQNTLRNNQRQASIIYVFPLILLVHAGKNWSYFTPHICKLGTIGLMTGLNNSSIDFFWCGDIKVTCYTKEKLGFVKIITHFLSHIHI
jgi:hypothetical protein